jgi:hypothetical protein
MAPGFAPEWKNGAPEGIRTPDLYLRREGNAASVTPLARLCSPQINVWKT